jgi:hypothetical protein
MSLSEGFDWYKALKKEKMTGIKAPDNVNHPSHYNQSGIEAIEAVKAATGDGFEGYLQGNIMKYLWRYKYKNGLEDLKKAQWYLDRLIKEVGDTPNEK